MSLYNKELIKNIQTSSHANENEDDQAFEFNLTDLVYHRWEILSNKFISSCFSSFMLSLLFLSISSLPSPFFALHLIQKRGRKKHVIQNKNEGERSVFPGQKEITTY